MTIESDEQSKKTIDYAIDFCKEYVTYHSKKSVQVLLASLYTVLGSAFGIAFLFRSDFQFNVINTIVFAVVAILSVVFAVLMANYRFHLHQVAKFQHFTIGFLRIRIAGNVSKSGFQGEVREALTKDAFVYSEPSSGRKIANPVPGHPSAEVLTEIADRVFALVERRKHLPSE